MLSSFNAMKQPLFKPKTPVAVAIDFDGTITEIDVVDGLLVQFSRDRAWIRHEADWVAGRIASSECLRLQLRGVDVGPRELADFLRGIALDPGFLSLVRFLKDKSVPLAVLSDGFDLFIQEIFRIYKVKGVPFKANRLKISGRSVAASFPYKRQAKCGRCGHCKRTTLSEARKRVRRFIFIGDGLSDACAVEAADSVFAKGKLAEHCRKTGRAFIPYRNLNDVVRSLPAVLRRLGEEDSPAKTPHEKIAFKR